MPRHVWAKVYCDLLRHPKIIGRPDSDVRLFLGLILYAKEYAPETGLVPLTPAAMRDAFGIKASLSAVKLGVAYFVDCGVLVSDGEHVRLKDFAERQAKTDTPEAQAARSKAYYDRHKAQILNKRKTSRGLTDFSRVVSRENSSGLTRMNASDGLTRSHAEVEEEKERDLDLREEHVGGNPQAPVDNSDLEGLSDSDKAQIQSLLAKGKAAEATALLAKVRKRSELQDNPRPEAPR
jgi:hypothetical protein